MGTRIENTVVFGGTSITGTGVATTSNNQNLESSVIDSRGKQVSYGMSIGAYVSDRAYASAFIYGSDDMKVWSQVDTTGSGPNSAYCRTGTTTRYRYYKCRVTSSSTSSASSAYVFVSE